MALSYADHIVHEPDDSTGKPWVKGAGVSVEAVLATLAANPDVEALLAVYPRLTVDDVRAVLAFAHARIVDTSRETPAKDSPGFVSPQDFYREVTQREDIRRILAALAK